MENVFGDSFSRRVRLIWTEPGFKQVMIVLGIVVLVLAVSFKMLGLALEIENHKLKSDHARQITPVPTPAPAAASVLPVFTDMLIQKGPCEGYPGTIQVVANVCDDGRGSFFVLVNTADTTSARLAYTMMRLRSYKLDYPNRHILSVVPVTDTVCASAGCAITVIGAFGQYELRP